MERTISDAHNHVEPERLSAAPPSGPAPLNIYWGRTAMAGVGLIALFTAVIAGALNIFHLGSAGLAWTGLVVFLGVLVGLRTLAVRDRNARHGVSRLAAERAATEAKSAETGGHTVEPRETVLFDGANGAEPAPVQKPLTSDELRNVALRVAAKGSADAKLAHTQTLAEGEIFTETWEPVEVPKPGYVTAARAAAAAAAPLAVPEVPKSAGTSIKADQAGIGVPAVERDAPVEAVVEGSKAGEASAVAAVPASTSHGLSNLDVVLQRRRA